MAAMAWDNVAWKGNRPNLTNLCIVTKNLRGLGAAWPMAWEDERTNLATISFACGHGMREQGRQPLVESATMAWEERSIPHVSINPISCHTKHGIKYCWSWQPWHEITLVEEGTTPIWQTFAFWPNNCWTKTLMKTNTWQIVDKTSEHLLMFQIFAWSNPLTGNYLTNICMGAK